MAQNTMKKPLLEEKQDAQCVHSYDSIIGFLLPLDKIVILISKRELSDQRSAIFCF